MATGARCRLGVIERNNRRTRWFHACVSLVVLALLGSGWWLWAGLEGRPSPVAMVTGLSDAELHTAVGWFLAGLAVLGAVAGRRAVRTLVAESVRYRRSDLQWFRRWLPAVLTGRFAPHEGHFDPGQRVANLVLLGLLAALTLSGAGLALISGGPAFVWLNGVHRWSTYLLTPVLAGHVLIASGVLPGYRGVWRAMHLGGKLRVTDAQRVWPGWARRQELGRDG